MMPINEKELIEAAEMVAEINEMRVTMKCSLGGACITAITTFLGGLVAGPVGLVAGASFGGLAAYTATKDKFKSAVQVIREEMTHEQKMRLANHIQDALKDLDITDAIRLFQLISQREAAPLMLISAVVKKLLESDLKYCVTEK